MGTVRRLWEFSKLLIGPRIVQPVMEGLLHVVTLTLSNVMFHASVRRIYTQTGRVMCLYVLGFVFGAINLILCRSLKMLQYVLATTVLLTGLYQIILLLRRRYPGINLYHVTKTLAIGLGVISLRFLDEKDDFLIYLSTYTMMCFKLMLVADDSQHRTYEVLNTWTKEKAPGWFETIGYLTYTGYIPFKDFKTLCGKEQHPQIERWWRMLGWSALRAITFRTISYELLEYNTDTFGPILQNKYMLFVARAFQVRCRYYYWLQLRELEAIAVNIKRGGWVKHTAFNFNAAELSIRLVDFLIAFNLPISSSLRNRCTDENSIGYENINVTIYAVLIVVSTYNIYYGIFLAFVVLICIRTQIFSFEQLSANCRMACTTIDCQHIWTKRHKSFLLLRFILITLNQTRICLLFCNVPGWSWVWAITYSLVALVFVDFSCMLILNYTSFAERPPPPKRKQLRRPILGVDQPRRPRSPTPLPPPSVQPHKRSRKERREAARR